jgi:CBS domain containing-hemolysin-like protein
MVDVLEEIVGEITVVYDRETPPVVKVDEETCRVTARLPVEDLEELYDVEIPHEDVETVGGLLAMALGRVPIPGATARVNGLTLVAESSKGRRNRIGTVLFRRNPEEDDDRARAGGRQARHAGAGRAAPVVGTAHEAARGRRRP